MKTLKAKVQNGHLVLEEPTALPEGTVVELAWADEGDDLDDRERAALHAALQSAWKSACAGTLRPAEGLTERLRAR